MTYSQRDFEKAAENIINIGRILYQRGWTPATSSNFSQRLDGRYCAITVSGKDKGNLTIEDVMVVDLEGIPQTPQKPSAETLLHTSLYAWDSSIGAVLHTHSLHSNLISCLCQGNRWRLQGYELLKAFAGIDTHETVVDFPIFDNSQDIPQLAKQVREYLERGIPCWGYLIRKHGVYTWGRDMAEALRHLEAIEYLMECELELMRLKGVT
ncbi:MAG: methylthioribulose 1-phosphate dehydratase [Geminocystis sp.]|nr:methylthioribulose 1-phosphate dehydratase [Geminocystis sp.]HIK38356.1 methylthioribulose 1-phosphate dehydratase [Geminocystis sp. M7585_C2015_104]MCS7148739.1 methylthioribulose 1-phosphate dehydratase [Geminocystis sp.]MCX8078387.1 methylthioribulose 1-phosphate dehydratase [Geminocystis sp.]MDW8116112.1 methylthioribulose 1-phosphate dehydratase [Geminocystis sp.]